MMPEGTGTSERLALADLEPKTEFDGQVTSVELYGAFVDIGAEKDGLVHISQISEGQVNRVADVLNPGDTVKVWVRSVDLEQGRIELTMVEPPERTLDELEADEIVTGTVTKLAPYGAFVDIGVGRDGLVHISEMAEGHTNAPSEVVEVGQEIEVRVVKVNHKRRRIELSLLGLDGEPETEIEADESEEPPMTAMEMAWQDAMRRQGKSIKVSSDKKSRRKRRADIRRQQVAIIAQTLQSKQE
jgi:ribosomal protein S1